VSCEGYIDGNDQGERLSRTESVFSTKRRELELHELQMGSSRGRLAVALDSLTDAMIMVGQHGVYCQSNRQPGLPAMDLQIVMQSLNEAKELVSSVMDELRAERDASSS
jgi:hypothetical protein